MSISARLRAGVTTPSAEATRRLAAEFAATLPPDTTLALHGDMGVGKTTFVQGLAEGLGVHEHVTSPTFAIYSVYRGAGRTLVHMDAYRLERGAQVEELLLDEFLRSPWGWRSSGRRKSPTGCPRTRCSSRSPSSTATSTTCGWREVARRRSARFVRRARLPARRGCHWKFAACHDRTTARLPAGPPIEARGRHTAAYLANSGRVISRFGPA